MDQNLMASIRKTMENKSTEKLKRIYTNHNESWRSPEAFDVIYQILLQRGEMVTPHPPKPPTPPILLTPPSPSSKIVGGIIGILVGLFILP